MSRSASSRSGRAAGRYTAAGRAGPRVALCAAALLLAGCAPDAMRRVEVVQPMTVRPVAPTPVPSAANRGAIYQPATYRPLFEDHRARNVGDLLTININEKVSASKTASSSANRAGAMDFVVPEAQIGGRGIKGGSLSANSKNDFEGKGDSAANNVFTGAITVTVIDVLPNGNLLVAGEKQIGINQGSEFVRLSGVVDPRSILAGNVVSSTQVADARLEYRGAGYINEAQTMGWLSRVFLSVMPF
jgi:flagellar L-ring protein precursor FlgH